jgi:hypothetical protein
MFDFLNYFVIGLLIILSFQYNYSFFAPLIVLLYSLFFPGISNLILVIFLIGVLFFTTGEIISLWWIIIGVLCAVIIISGIFGKKSAQKEDGGNYEDLLKMLGNQ